MSSYFKLFLWKLQKFFISNVNELHYNELVNGSKTQGKYFSRLQGSYVLILTSLCRMFYAQSLKNGKKAKKRIMN